jgi:hypothetical protein
MALSTRSTSRCAKILGVYQADIEDLELVDYKVRILNGGTEAIDPRADRERPMASGSRWWTLGVSRQHHRCVISGADRFYRLQADEEPRHGGQGGGGVALRRGGGMHCSSE